MSLLDQLSDVVTTQMAGSAARKTGMNEGLTQKMLPIAMAALMGGIKKNAQSQDGANALASALSKHDGGLLDNVSQIENDDVIADGQKILGHILGGKQQQTEQALARTAGVDQAQIGQLLAMAAPAVLAALGRQQRQDNLQTDTLAQMVSNEGARAQQLAPKELGGLMQFLDKDGDGDFQDDLLETAGKSLLGGLFGKR